MRTIGRVALGIIVALLVLIGLVLAWAFVSYPTEYVMRLLRWGSADVYDYQKFPERRLEASKTPFKFESDPAEEIVREVFEQDPEIQDLEVFLERNGTQGFIVIQNDIIMYERYFSGASRDSIVTSFSVAKSYVSALIGIAIAEGFIGDVEDPITDYIPELAQRDPAFASITIRDLLRMSSGIEYRENSFFSGDDAKTYYYPDLRQLALEETSVVDAPGAYFLYNNYHPLLLGMVLERATNMSVSAYLESRIWQPIGTEFDGSWSLDSEQSGFEKMESGINGRVIDFAKFGRLYLHDGSWNGAQVVPAEWVRESTRPHAADLQPGDGYYSYFWWGRARADSKYDFVALGNHGQFIYVSPEKNLIIVRNGESYGEFGGAQRWLDMFYHFASNFEPQTGESAGLSGVRILKGDTRMKYRRLGLTDLKVSVVGIGTWQFGGEWGRTFTQEQVNALLRQAKELGINTIDTAECYGDHLSESLVGQAIHGDRDDWILATKFGHKFHSNFERTDHWSPEEVQGQLEDSLRALRTDHVDLYQFHSGSDEVFDQEDLWAMLNRQVEAGKIHHLGISIGSNDNLHQTQQAAAIGAGVVQVVYNRLDQAPEARVFSSCQEQDLGVLARVPLASGYLSGKYKPGTEFADPDDVRSRHRRTEVERKLKTVAEIQSNDMPEGVNMATWALAWCLQHPAVTSVIPGCKTVDQVKANAAAADLDLVREDHPQAVV